MVFLPDVAVPCDACDGRRYNRETLEARFKQHTIADVLDLTVAAAIPVFAGIPKVHRPLLRLAQAGLGYVRLGQPAPTLSGGEAQRLKLAAELAAADGADPGLSRPAIYVMDEPTSGLHALDVAALISVLRELCSRGHTVLAIEHHMDVVSAADYIAELGPDGGEGGGRILFQGPPGRLVEGESTPTATALQTRR
jgi:excinuclease ABC subunit A